MVTPSAAGSAHDPLAWLLETSHRLPPAELAEAVGQAMGRLGARSTVVYLADHDQAWLHPLAPAPPDAESMVIDGTVGGRAYALETTVSLPADDHLRMWVPLTDGTARLGVLRVDFDSPSGGGHDEADDGHRDRRVEHVAALAAELVVAKSQYSDVFERARRGQIMSPEAELQRRTLPPVAIVTPAVSVAGILLPAYEVAGDSFDYAVNEDALDVAIIDSVGHDMASSSISHLVQGSLRNSRRGGRALPEAYRRADEAVARVFPDLLFATAAFGTLDLGSGRFHWVCAGHPPPLLIRAGRVVGTGSCVPALPIGLGYQRRSDPEDPTVNELVLEPGDRLLLYTDGVTEGGRPGGERFGFDRLTDLLGRHLLADLPPAETLRRLVQAVLEHSGQQLRDDTTLLLVEYGGVPPPG